MKWYLTLGSVSFVSILILALNLYSSFSRDHDTAQNSKANNSLEIADMRIEEMHFIEQSNTGSTWQLLARSASFYDHKHLVLLHQVRAHLTSDSPRTVYVEADYGQLDSITGNLSLAGSVQLQYLQDYTIQTEGLSWDAAGRVLQTDKAVHIASTFVHIAGVGLYGEASQHSFVLRDDVHASFTLQ